MKYTLTDRSCLCWLPEELSFPLNPADIKFYVSLYDSVHTYIWGVYQGCGYGSELFWESECGLYRSRVADPRCLSRISDLGSRIQQHQKRSGNKIFCPTIYCSHNYHEIVNNLIFNKNFVSAKTLRIIVLFTQKFVIKLPVSKIWV